MGGGVRGLPGSRQDKFAPRELPHLHGHQDSTMPPCPDAGRAPPSGVPKTIPGALQPLTGLPRTHVRRPGHSTAQSPPESPQTRGAACAGPRTQPGSGWTWGCKAQGVLRAEDASAPGTGGRGPQKFAPGQASIPQSPSPSPSLSPSKGGSSGGSQGERGKLGRSTGHHPGCLILLSDQSEGLFSSRQPPHIWDVRESLAHRGHQ